MGFDEGAGTNGFDGSLSGSACMSKCVYVSAPEGRRAVEQNTHVHSFPAEGMLGLP